MATLTTLPSQTLIPKSQVNVATSVSQATEDLVNTVVDNATKADGIPNDALLQIVVWVVDAAGAVAQDALSQTQNALAADAKAQQQAECARTWSIVSAIVAVIIIIIAIVVAVFTFGAGASGVAAGSAAAISAVLAVASAVCAIISAVVTIITATPNILMIQGVVLDSLAAFQTMISPSTTTDQRESLRQSTVPKLRGAMTAIQSASAQRLLAASVDLTLSTAASDQTTRALQKLLGYLRQQQLAGPGALVVTELGQLVQTHSVIVAQLKIQKPTIPVPGLTSPTLRG